MYTKHKGREGIQVGDIARPDEMVHFHIDAFENEVKCNKYDKEFDRGYIDATPPPFYEEDKDKVFADDIQLNDEISLLKSMASSSFDGFSRGQGKAIIVKRASTKYIPMKRRTTEFMSKPMDRIPDSARSQQSKRSMLSSRATSD